MPASAPVSHPDHPVPPLCIVGAGALGSLIAVRLALVGQAVGLLGRGAVVPHIQQQGLTLQGPAGPQVAPVVAFSDPAALRAARVVLVCVKSADTAALASELAPWLAPDALVVSLQNGVANGAALQAQMTQTVAVGLAYVAAALEAPGVVRHHGGQQLVLGLMPPCQSPQPGAGANGPAVALQGLAAQLEQAGFAVRLSADPQAEAWRKLVVNCACNAVSALTQATYATMAATPGIEGLQDAVVDECVAVAQAEGVVLDAAALKLAVRQVALNMAGQRSSTAQDLARARPSEIDHLNGHIVQRAQAHGLLVPANQALWALVKLAERSRAGG